MSHLIPAIKLCNRIQMQNKDQLTQGADQPANNNYSWQDSNNPKIKMSLNMYSVLTKTNQPGQYSIFIIPKNPLPIFQHCLSITQTCRYRRVIPVQFVCFQLTSLTEYIYIIETCNKVLKTKTELTMWKICLFRFSLHYALINQFALFTVSLNREKNLSNHCCRTKIQQFLTLVNHQCRLKFFSWFIAQYSSADNFFQRESQKIEFKDIQ